MRIGSQIPQRLPARPVRVAAAPQSAPAPKAVKARGADPLPTFSNSRDYQNYVINLVALARSTDVELQAARKALNEGKGGQLQVNALTERLDAIKLQLMVLRDNYPIPGDWSRSKWLGGEGFDKDKFWKEQVEAIPGKEVVVTPEPPKPVPPKPQPKPEEPAKPTPPPVTPPAPVGDRAAFENKLKLADLAVQNSRNGSDRDNAIRNALGAAISLAQTPQDCILVIKKAESTAYYGNTRDDMMLAAAKRAGELMRTADDAVAIAEAARDHAYHGNNRDKVVGTVLKDALRLKPSVDDAVKLVKAAENTAYYGNTRDDVMKAVLNTTAATATTIDGCIKLADAARDYAYHGNNRDDVVKTALRRAIALAGTVEECEKIMSAAKDTAYYSNTSGDLVKEAMEKGTGL